MKHQKENLREFIRQASKIVHEWNGHLEIFSCAQVVENSRQCLLLHTDILTENSRRVPLLNAPIFLSDYIKSPGLRMSLQPSNHCTIYISNIFFSVGKLESNITYIFGPQFASPLTSFTWAVDKKGENLSFCCFIWKKEVLHNHKSHFISYINKVTCL